jgi:hypothetical protein
MFVLIDAVVRNEWNLWSSFWTIPRDHHFSINKTSSQISIYFVLSLITTRLATTSIQQQKEHINLEEKLKGRTKNE